MHTITKIWIFLAVFLVFSISFSQGENWLSGWPYRIPITINNTLNSNNLEDYQVLVTINTQELISQGKMRSDCGDIRFTDSDGSTLLNYWIESGCNSANTRIWVKVPNIPANSNKTIYLYYGNPNANSMSNGDLVFEIFDDFDGASLNTSKWNTYASGGTYSVSNGAITFSTSAAGQYVWIYSKINFTYPVFAEIRTLTVSNSPTPRLGLTNQTTFKTDGNFYYSYSADWYGYNPSLRIVGDTASTGFAVVSTARSFPSYSIWSFTWQNGMQRFFINYTLVLSGSNTQVLIPSHNYYVIFGIAGDAAGSVSIDWIRVRKYTSPEPTILLGNEETIIILITIHSPQNTTYYTNVIMVNVTTYYYNNYTVLIYLDNQLKYAGMYFTLDGRLITHPFVGEENIKLNLTIDSEGAHNLTVILETASRITQSSSVIFTFKNFERVNINLYSDYNYLPNQTVENFYYFFELEIVNANPYADFNLEYFNYTNNYTIQKLTNNKLLLKFYTENINSNENIFVNRTALFTLSAYLTNINKTFYYNFTYNFLVYNLNLYNCTNPNTLRILAFDEETRQNITLNYSYLRISYYSFDENYKVTKTFENSLNICVYPNFTNYYFATIENILLRKDGYAFAEYYSYEKIILSNFTREISLYLLPNQYATPIKFRLPGENYILAVERRYNNDFVFLRSTKADFNRYALIYLRPYDVFYRIKVYDLNFNLCFISSDFRIANSEYTLEKCQVNITFETVKSPFPEKNVIINCNLLGNNLTCEFESVDKLDHNVTIEIYKIAKPFGRFLYNRTSIKAVTGQINFHLEDGTYEIIVYANSVLQHLLTKILQIGEGFVKNEALLYMFLLISIGLAVAGAVSNPIVTLIGQILLSIVMFTLNVSVFAISMVSSLVLLTAIAFYFLRR